MNIRSNDPGTIEPDEPSDEIVDTSPAQTPTEPVAAEQHFDGRLAPGDAEQRAIDTDVERLADDEHHAAAEYGMAPMTLVIRNIPRAAPVRPRLPS